MRNINRKRRSRQPRGRVRTLPIKGTKTDKNRFYHCWVCGFVNDVEAGTLGGPNDTDATVLILRESATVFPVVFPATFGNEGNVYEVSGGGCPMCHTTNWRGDHRS